LITRLVERGLMVAENDGDHLLLSFDIMLVTHSKEKIVRTSRGVYQSLAPGFVVNRHIPLTGPGNQLLETEKAVHRSEVNLEAGLYTVVLPENEIMITCSLTHNGGYIMRNSATYYIHDPDWWHYKQRSVRLQPAVVNYQIVDK
jgi:hypothetical protein